MYRNLILTFFIGSGLFYGQDTFVDATSVNYRPPSASLISISLQTHNGKLRFGEQDQYFVKPDGTYISHKDSNYKVLEKEMSHNFSSKHAFEQLLKIRFQEEIFDVMDRTLFTLKSSNMYDKDLKSFAAQEQTLILANALCSKKERRRFFCNDKEEDCLKKFPDNGYYDEPRNKHSWGGKSSSEFQKLRAYTTFVNELLPEVLQWGKSLFPENTLLGYFVTKAYLGTYDFNAHGYWLDTSHFPSSEFLLQWSTLQPKNTAERKLLHPHGSQLLFPMTPDAAEKFSENNQEVFLVFDVTATVTGIDNYRADKAKTNYTINSPLITLYTDDSLTKKVGALDITTATIKTQ